MSACKGERMHRLTAGRRLADVGAQCVFIACMGGTVACLVVLLAAIAERGMPALSWQFITSFPSRFPDQAGIWSALCGSYWLMALTCVISVPWGLAAAVYLEEYAPRGRLTTFIEVNVANLASVPSIVYGILGLAVFVRTCGLGRSVLAGALTLSLLVLPSLIITSREALRSVPRSIRDASYALGARRCETILHQVIPAALPGILTGAILSLSRALGETAPLVTIGALTYVAFTPAGPLDGFTALPIQIFNWASRPQPEFSSLAAAGIIVLLGLLVAMNAAAIGLRHVANRRMSG